jgi:predicted dehydrogenase
VRTTIPALRVAIIGTGAIAREHAKAIAMLTDGVRLVGVADTDRDRLHAFCRAFQPPRVYTTTTAAMTDPEVDMVTITTPPAAHEAIVVAALDHGKYVLCEKPLAQSLASAARIADVAARHPGRVAVNHQMRYDAAFRRLIWICQSGLIGEIRSGVVERNSFIPPSAPTSGWWGSWKIAGGGVLITQLIHELDLLLLIMGRPLTVHATIDTRYSRIESEDSAEVTIRFSNGCSARCVASVNSGTIRGGFRIHGTRGSANLAGDVTTNDPADAVRIAERVDRALPDTCRPSHSAVDRGARFIARRLGIGPRPALTPHARLYGDIARCIDDGAPLPISPAEAVASLELCMAAYESALSGKEVALPLTRSSAVYDGISKEDYEARKCSRHMAEELAL